MDLKDLISKLTEIEKEFGDIPVEIELEFSMDTYYASDVFVLCYDVLEEKKVTLKNVGY